MNHVEQATRLVSKLAAALGEPRPAWKNGACALRVEGRDFSFFCGEKPAALFLQTDLGELSARPNQEAALTALLRANHLWTGTVGGSFGLAEGRLQYVFRLDFPLPEGWAEHDEDLLPDLLPHILGALEAAEDRLGSPAGGGGAPAVPMDEEELLRV